MSKISEQEQYSLNKRNPFGGKKIPHVGENSQCERKISQMGVDFHDERNLPQWEGNPTDDRNFTSARNFPKLETILLMARKLP